MKKKLSAILAMGLSLSLVACGTTPAESGESTQDSNALAGTYDITVWVSESDGVADLTKTQIQRFCDENPGIVINATVEGVTESESASQMITSVEDGADLYCFAQDQLSRLVLAGALNKLGDDASNTVRERNDEISIKAASVGGDLYCYPLTSDNGYFMYYDKSVIPEEHLDSLEDIIADCENAGKMFSMELETSAWYNAAFFFGTGCVSEWTTDTEGEFTSVNDTFNSDAGLIALKGMQKLLKSSCYNSSSAGADFAAAVPSAVLVSGTWASAAAKEALGDNYAATDLPSFEVDGKSYHLGSFSGCKLMGIKPQEDNVKTAVLQKLALYLTNETCQLERFNLVGWGPSNKTAQQDPAVQADPALAALAAQAAYSVPQGNIHGSWWDIAKIYAVSAKEATTDDELKAALQSYADSLDELFSLSDDVKYGFTVIGSFSGYNWDTDITMTQDPEGTFTSEPIAFKAGDEFKCRQGLSWDVSFGNGGENFVVDADGTYRVQLVYDKAAETGVITLIAE